MCGWTGWRIPQFARSNLAKLHNRVANLSSPKKAIPCPKNPDSSFEAYTHKTCTTTHKIEIKTRQKHRYNPSPFFRSIFFPCYYIVVHLFLLITSITFRATVKFFQYSVHPACSSPEVCNEYAAQTMFCQSQANPTENKLEKARFFWLS